MALIYGDLYAALRSANVTHELAQEAARVVKISPKNITYAKIKSHLCFVQLLLAMNMFLTMISLAAACSLSAPFRWSN